MAEVVILVVEDEAVVAMDLGNRLRRLGYHVPAIAMTGQEAIEFACLVRPDVIFMDVGLREDIDGITVAQRILACVFIPIVFVTAYTDAQTRQRAAAVPAAAFLSKPFTDEDVLGALDAALRMRRTGPC